MIRPGVVVQPPRRAYRGGMNTIAAITPFVAGSGEWGNHGAWGLLWLAFWLVALGATAWLVVRLTRGRRRSGIDQARDILAERYARGELTSDEYRERLEQLK
jgi:putative membrane protein